MQHNSIESAHITDPHLAPIALVAIMTHVEVAISAILTQPMVAIVSSVKVMLFTFLPNDCLKVLSFSYIQSSVQNSLIILNSLIFFSK